MAEEKELRVRGVKMTIEKKVVRFKGIPDFRNIKIEEGFMIEREKEFKIDREWDCLEIVKEINYENEELTKFTSVKRGNNGQGTKYINEIEYNVDRKNGEVKEINLWVHVGEKTWFTPRPEENFSLYLHPTPCYPELNEFLKKYKK